MTTSIDKKSLSDKIRSMWELHLRRMLLIILEKHRIWTGKALTREQWVGKALRSFWVWFHHPFLGTFNRLIFRRKIEKSIDPCIPQEKEFISWNEEQKETYYTKYNPAKYENGNPAFVNLEITDKGMEFISIGGFIQTIGGKFSKMWALFGIILSFIIGKYWDNIIELVKRIFTL